MDPGPHNGVGPRGVGNAQSENTSSIVLIVVAAATTPGRTIEVTRNQINVLRDHKSTSSLDNFLGNTSFLGQDVVDV